MRFFCWGDILLCVTKETFLANQNSKQPFVNRLSNVLKANGFETLYAADDADCPIVGTTRKLKQISLFLFLLFCNDCVWGGLCVVFCCCFFFLVKQTFLYAAQVNRLAIIEKCEVKEGRGPSHFRKLFCLWAAQHFSFSTKLLHNWNTRR